jgi:hypothetical protein
VLLLSKTKHLFCVTEPTLLSADQLLLRQADTLQLKILLPVTIHSSCKRSPETKKNRGLDSGEKGSIHFVKSVEAMVTTGAQHSLSALMNQRKRWASKIPVQMSAFTIFIAVVAYLLHAGLLLSGVLMFYTGNVLFFLIPLVVKMIPEFVLLSGVSSFFKKTSLLFLFLPAQIIYPVYVSIIGLASITGDYQWKGRKVK